LPQERTPGILKTGALLDLFVSPFTECGTAVHILLGGAKANKPFGLGRRGARRTWGNNTDVTGSGLGDVPKNRPRAKQRR
jgi:hypothetical protein